MESTDQSNQEELTKPCHVCGSIRGNYTEFWNFCSACGLPPVIHEYVDSYVKGKEEVSKLKERRELLRFYHPYVTDSQVKEDMERYLEETEQELKNNLGIMYDVEILGKPLPE